MVLGVETAGSAPVQQLSNNSGAGTTFGQSITDLISFYNNTPVAQQASTVDLITQLVNLDLVASGTVNKSKPAPVVITASTNLAATTNANRVNILNAAGGFSVNLPAATGTGNTYEFLIGTTVTTGTTAILVSSGDAMEGSAFQVSGASTACFNTASSTTGLRFNGSTVGGFVGDLISVTDVSTAVWSAQFRGKVTGTAATPFY